MLGSGASSSGVGRQHSRGCTRLGRKNEHSRYGYGAPLNMLVRMCIAYNARKGASALNVSKSRLLRADLRVAAPALLLRPYSNHQAADDADNDDDTTTMAGYCNRCGNVVPGVDVHRCKCGGLATGECDCSSRCSNRECTCESVDSVTARSSVASTNGITASRSELGHGRWMALMS